MGSARGRCPSLRRMPISEAFGRPPAEQFAAINAWPTLAGQGIQVTSWADDWTAAEVRLELTDANANYLGTAFGGSLFSMLDPFFVILAMNQLGDGYVVWDKAAEIEFVSPGTGPVTAQVEMPASVIDELRAAAAGGAKVLRWFAVDITGEDGSVVARVRRQLYVRERRKTT